MHKYVVREYDNNHTPYKQTYSYRSGFSSIRRDKIDEYLNKETQSFKDKKLAGSYNRRTGQKAEAYYPADNIDTFLSKSNLRIREKKAEKIKTAPLKTTEVKRLKKRSNPEDTDQRKKDRNYEKEQKILKKRSTTAIDDANQKFKRYVYSKLPQNTQTQYKLLKKDHQADYRDHESDFVKSNFQFDKSYEKDNIYTPNIQNRTGITMQSTNAKGYRSDLKSGESPSPFRFTPGYMRTTYTHKNLERENHEMGNREEMDPSDSINDRLDQKYDSGNESIDDQFKTPNAFNRIKAYNQLENPPYEGGIPRCSMVGTLVPK